MTHKPTGVPTVDCSKACHTPCIHVHTCVSTHTHTLEGVAVLIETETLDQPYTLHPTHYTLHPTPYTPHPTPYTPHPRPSTLIFMQHVLMHALGMLKGVHLAVLAEAEDSMYDRNLRHLPPAFSQVHRRLCCVVHQGKEWRLHVRTPACAAVQARASTHAQKRAYFRYDGRRKKCTLSKRRCKLQYQKVFGFRFAAGTETMHAPSLVCALMLVSARMLVRAFECTRSCRATKSARCHLAEAVI